MLVLIFVKYFLHLHLYPVFTSPCFLSIPHFLQGLVSLLRVLFSLIHTKHTDKGNSRHQHQHRFQHHTSYLSLFLHNQRLWWFWQICGVLNINITSYLYNRISVDWCQQNSDSAYWVGVFNYLLHLPQIWTTLKFYKFRCKTKPTTRRLEDLQEVKPSKTQYSLEVSYGGSLA